MALPTSDPELISVRDDSWLAETANWAQVNGGVHGGSPQALPIKGTVMFLGPNFLQDAGSSAGRSSPAGICERASRPKDRAQCQMLWLALSGLQRARSPFILPVLLCAGGTKGRLVSPSASTLHYHFLAPPRAIIFPPPRPTGAPALIGSPRHTQWLKGGLLIVHACQRIKEWRGPLPRNGTRRACPSPVATGWHKAHSSTQTPTSAFP